MAYLLDTSTVVDFLRKKKNLSGLSLQEKIYISRITQAELYYGAYKSSNTKANLEIVDSFIEEMQIDIIELDRDVVHKYGQIKAQLERKGNRLEDFDLLIAAAALIHRLTLITGNIKHFARIEGLEVVG